MGTACVGDFADRSHRLTERQECAGRSSFPLLDSPNATQRRLACFLPVYAGSEGLAL